MAKRTKSGLVDKRSIRAFARRVAEEFRPHKIILFGSYAYGRPTPDSDVDLLVIMPFEGKGYAKALEILDHVNPQEPVELAVKTPEDLAWRLRWNDFFLREIMEKGEVLYESPGS